MSLTDNEQFEFFWSGIYSQWYPSLFTVNGVDYTCAEQYMMASKARLFNDTETLNAIMDTDEPKKQKALGRKVKNFDPAAWEFHRYSIVLAASIAKFTQNENLRLELLATGTKTLVEASPYDKIWGIGMGVGEDGVDDRMNWKGLNLLGKALTETREYIRAMQWMER